MAQQPVQAVLGTPSGSTTPPEPVPLSPEPQGFADWHADLDENAAVRQVVFSTMEADKLYSIYLKHFFGPVKAGGSEAGE